MARHYELFNKTYWHMQLLAFSNPQLDGTYTIIFGKYNGDNLMLYLNAN